MCMYVRMYVCMYVVRADISRERDIHRRLDLAQKIYVTSCSATGGRGLVMMMLFLREQYVPLGKSV